MFQAKPLTADLTVRTEPQALMQGEEVVALVFEERYAQLLSQSPQMLELIERIAAAPCDFESDGEHDCACLACEARNLLATLPASPLLN
jgi:hypothetical protein